MMDRVKLFEILYALAARNGRDKALFGTCVPAAREAFIRSLIGNGFPELWFEVPLAGDPWFDFHALTSHEEISADDDLPETLVDGGRAAFAWFGQQRDVVRQLALSWDTGKGVAELPAVQLLVRKDDAQVTCGFLEAVGRPDAKEAYRIFHSSLPDGWFACYAGVFPARLGHNLRVECIPTYGLQQMYADDPALLKKHLNQVGLTGLGETIVDRCQLLAQMPFRLEFQFDVEPDGRVGTTFGASVRFAQPPRTGGWEGFAVDGSAGTLMRQVESWGLADERWRLLEETIFAMRVSRGEESRVAYCYPAFCKLRWREGEPVDAKAYLIAGIQ